MRASYDSEANALWIHLVDEPRARFGEEIGGDGRCVVSLDDGRPVSVELLYPDLGFEPLRLAADRFDLDAEELEGAARAAVRAPDREVTLTLAARVPA